MPEPENLMRRLGTAAAGLGSGPARRPKLRVAVQVGLAVLILAFLVLTVVTQWSELRDEDVHFHAGWVVPATVALITVNALVAAGWSLLLRALGRHIPEARAQMVWGQSLLARYVPGSVLMLVGRVLLAEREGVERRTTLASTAYEQGLLMIAGLLISSYALITTDALGSAPGRIALLAMIPVGLVILHPRVFGPLADFALAKLGREPLPTVLPVKVVGAMLVYYVANWAFFGVAVWLAARTVFPVDAGDLPTLVAAQALGYIAAVVTVIFPGGLGVRDGAFALVLAPAIPGGFGVAAAIAIAVRLLSTLAEVFYAGLVTLIGRRTAPAPGAPAPTPEASPMP